MADFFSTPRRSVDELIYWVGDWTEALVKVAEMSSVLFIHSQEHDWLPYKEVEEFCANKPNVDCFILEDTAQLFLYEKGELLCRAIGMLCRKQQEMSAGQATSLTSHRP